MKPNTDFGALYKGDTLLLDNDIEAMVIGFDFDPNGRPDNCTVLTDMGPLFGRLGTPARRICASPAPLPPWTEVQRWFSRDDDLIETLTNNTGALA